MSSQQILTTVMTRIVVDETIYHAKPHSICFLPQYQRQKNMFFSRARAEKGIAWHIDASSVVETLIYHGKLANQIARLAAIVVKSFIDNDTRHHNGQNVLSATNFDLCDDAYRCR